MGTTTTEDTITYNPATDTYRLSHDWWHGMTLSTAVSMGVATITNTAPTELDPLYESVNPDALNHLFDSPTAESSRHSAGQMTFSNNDCTVTVYADGMIEITPLDASGAMAAHDDQPTHNS